MSKIPPAAQVLIDFRPRHAFFVGIDSDGCAFDAMELKQKECFTPSTIRVWGLQPISKYARETADGYSRRIRVDGAIISSEWDVASKTGSYARLAEDRLYVRVSGGGGVTAEEMKAAVELFGRETLAQFAAES